MKTSAIVRSEWQGVFAVPPLARRLDSKRSIDFDGNTTIVNYLRSGGISRFMYGGNAFLHHVTMAEYGDLLDWLGSFPDESWMIPSVGPAFGRALDQARLLRQHHFPCVMALPSADPRDVTGLEVGYREIADAAGCPLVLYIKEDGNFGPDISAGLDAVARLVQDGTCVGIKYAIVRDNPAVDPYLDALLTVVDRDLVLSGMGERPAVVHLDQFGLPGFTTGSGCVAPSLAVAVFDACSQSRYQIAEQHRSHFLPLEDARDLWGPARVLHSAVSLAGIVATGPIPPFVSALSEGQQMTLQPIARALHARDIENRGDSPAGSKAWFGDTQDRPFVDA